MKSAAIVILTHNFLEEATRPCLESIYACRCTTPFEVVVVDNASTDGTREYLTRFAEGKDNFRFILNDHNTGYARGNNIGMLSTEADCYVLLNNDTLVTDFWLDRLTSFLDEHPEVGMVGPVSNSVGNEQVISVSSSDPATAIPEGISWTEMCRDHFFYTDMLGFFCVAIRSDLVRKIGLLDEMFGIGMFEDDDYCRRAISAGYRLACREDVFVYHRGSLSFRTLGTKGYELYTANKEKYEQKHNVKWQPSFTPRTYCRWIEAQLDTVGQGDVQKEKVRNKVKVVAKLDDFFLAAQAVEAELFHIKSSLSWQILVKLNRLFPLRRLEYLWRKRASRCSGSPTGDER